MDSLSTFLPPRFFFLPSSSVDCLPASSPSSSSSSYSFETIYISPTMWYLIRTDMILWGWWHFSSSYRSHNCVEREPVWSSSLHLYCNILLPPSYRPQPRRSSIALQQVGRVPIARCLLCIVVGLYRPRNCYPTYSPSRWWVPIDRTSIYIHRYKSLDRSIIVIYGYEPFLASLYSITPSLAMWVKNLPIFW